MLVAKVDRPGAKITLLIYSGGGERAKYIDSLKVVDMWEAKKVQSCKDVYLSLFTLIDREYIYNTT